MNKIDRNYRDWFDVKTDVQILKNRPVVVFKKLSEYGFIGIPLTTKDHTDVAPDWYVHFRFGGKDEYAALHQVESVSVYRLYRLVGSLDDNDIKTIQNGFMKLYDKKIPLP